MTATARKTDCPVASARASREAAARFREQVARLSAVSFEGSLTAIAEFRLMARDLARGGTVTTARNSAQAAVSALRGRPLALAAE